MKTHKDLTTKKEYPKTIKVKTSYDGLYNFQVYHVYNAFDKSMIILNAYNNDFEGITLEDYQPEIKETDIYFHYEPLTMVKIYVHQKTN